MIPTWLIAAFGEIDQFEIDGPEDNSQIQAYLASVGLPGQHDEVPWCSAFVNWVMIQSGEAGTNKPNARSWLDWGSVTVPRLGCITIMKRGESWQGHVTFYLDKGSNGLIYCLGGNQSNRVCISAYPEEKIIGYRWPT